MNPGGDIDSFVSQIIRRQNRTVGKPPKHNYERSSPCHPTHFQVYFFTFREHAYIQFI